MQCHVFNKEEFIFGTKDRGLDNLLLIIKYYLIQLRLHENAYQELESIKLVKIRWIADLRNGSKKLLKYKWPLITIWSNLNVWKSVLEAC